MMTPEAVKRCTLHAEMRLRAGAFSASNFGSSSGFGGWVIWGASINECIPSLSENLKKGGGARGSSVFACSK